MPTIASRRRVTTIVAVVALVLALLYAGRVAALQIGASEGDLPPVSVLRLPDGSEVVSQERACASGGCWLEVEVRPPDGVSPRELALAIGAAPSGGHPGTWWDPRAVSFWAEPALGVLRVELGYW